MNKILHGVLTYRYTRRIQLLKEFARVRANPEPTSVFISCMDSRLFPPQFTSARVGDMFVVRNAGNLIPHSPNEHYDSITTEPGALELGCIRNNIKDVVVCGHSDCKAMNLLFSIRDEIHIHTGTPLEVWVKKHGSASVKKYNNFITSPTTPLNFYTNESSKKPLLATIDPENKFEDVDKFSQINCLQQLQNIASYGFLQDRLRLGQVQLHAMWFDIYTGDVYLFSRERRQFILIDDTTLEHLLKDTASIVLPDSDCQHDGKDH